MKYLSIQNPVFNKKSNFRSLQYINFKNQPIHKNPYNLYKYLNYPKNLSFI